LTSTRAPRFTKTLIFRLSAAFLVVVALGLGGYVLWIQATVFSPYANKAEERWFERDADKELDALALKLDPEGSPERNQETLGAFRERVAQFGVELMIFGPDGTAVTSAPGDSLMAAVPKVATSLLVAMMDTKWDFDSYPEKSDVEAYENRIFDVDPIGDRAAPRGYLVASYQPVRYGADLLEVHSSLIDTQRLIEKVLTVMVILAACTLLLLIGWTSRRVSHLSIAMEAFTGGDLDRRVREQGSDEIADLGRHFNYMASHVETLVDSLRQKEQFQRQLIANLSHDLRTPMASLRGHVESLSLRFDQLEPAQRARALDTITGNLEHLDRLVERMLVLSRLDAGQAAIHPEEFSIVELSDSVIRRCEHLALPGGISLQMRAEPGLPLVKADPLQVALVLQNLIENGIKFNRPQGCVTLSLDAAADRRQVRIAVADTGQGIADADLPHIFDRFFTGDASRTRHEDAPAHLKYSSGLGLAIAAKVVAAHGDELKVESRRGEGATFHFNLPATATETRKAMAAEG
jgi:signal transduction histidine kinase